MLLSDIKHWPQRHEADCLVACAAMVLSYLGIQRDYRYLINLLETMAVGTPFSNLRKLRSALGVHVTIDRDSSVSTFEAVLDSGLPIIVAVDSDVSAIWPYYHHHAVVVVGYNDVAVFINNPAAGDAPQEVEMDTFLWAWSRRDYEYAIISLTEHT